MKVALTGANGFVGKIIKKGLSGDNHQVQPIRTDLEINFDEDAEVLIHCARSHKNIVGKGIEERVEVCLKGGRFGLNKTSTHWDSSYAKWVSEFETDVMLPYGTTIEALNDCPQLKHVIFISSIYGITPPTVRYIPYNYLCSKAAEIHLAKCLAVQFQGIVNVNTVILGGVHSDRKEAKQTPGFRAAYHKKTLTGKMVMPDEVYPAVKFLIESKGITGQQIRVDGGYGLA